MTSVAQLVRVEIFRAGIKGDREASDRKSPGQRESRGTQERRELRRFDLLNHHGNTLLGWLSVFTWEGRGGGGVPGFDMKMLTLSSVLGTCI